MLSAVEEMLVELTLPIGQMKKISTANLERVARKFAANKLTDDLYSLTRRPAAVI